MLVIPLTALLDLPSVLLIGPLPLIYTQLQMGKLVILIQVRKKGL